MTASAFDIALDMLRRVALDDRWITVKPNGSEHKGSPVLIGEGGEIKAGMGGKFNGRNIDDVPRGKNPHPVPEEKWQARQERMGSRNELDLQKKREAMRQNIARVKNSIAEYGEKKYQKRLNEMPEAAARIKEKEDQLRIVSSQLQTEQALNGKNSAAYMELSSQSDALNKELWQMRNAVLPRGRQIDMGSPEADTDFKPRRQASAPAPPTVFNGPQGRFNLANPEDRSALEDVIRGNLGLQEFIRNADMPMYEDGVFYDLETGIAYREKRRHRPAVTLNKDTAFDNAMYMLRKVVAKYAQDAEKGDVKEWITLSGQPVPVKEGQTRKEAGQAFTEKKEQAEADNDVFGEAFTTYRGKPSEAIEHLLREKRGHVPGAFNKEGLGDIDLPWGKTGKEGFGLAHIIERRNEQGHDGEAFVRELPKLIEEGRVEYRRERKNRAYIVNEGKEAVIRLDWDGKDRKWLVTAYFQDDNNALSSDRRTDLNQTCVDQKATRPNSKQLLSKTYFKMSKKSMKNSTALDRALVPLAFDRASVRSVDENGFMHVASSHITKATINPYRGREIPGWKEAGLDPDGIYQGLRDPEELKKSLPTWRGLPLHIEHHIDSAEEPQKLTRVGAVGTEVSWNAPYVDAPLIVWDKQAIDSIKDGSFKELSCAYRYDPDFRAGEYNGEPFDFVMRNIRGNHVALVEEGRAGPDVVVADAAPVVRRSKTSTLEKTAMKIRKWFRGALDGDPQTEQTEVDLAQAIVDLHRRDPMTGEMREVTEDDDKLAELRVLVGSLKDKLPPEDLKRLTDTIAALAAAEALDTAQEGKEDSTMDEDQKAAMHKAGCDAEDPDESRAFAEGVKYGEILEKNPAERAKLDREHESEGMRRAMDACGLDSENPAEAKAFAEGVKYGEEQGKAATDEDTEADPAAAKDEDKDAMIQKIIAAVPDLTPAQIKKMKDTLADLAYSPATGDEGLDEKVDAATDRAMRRRKALMATDAARIRAQATADAMERMRGLHEAVRRVRPLVGELDALAFDSARHVYAYALEQRGINPRQYDSRAWRGMVDVLLRGGDAFGAVSRGASMAQDAKPLPDSGPFANLSSIRIGR